MSERAYHTDDCVLSIPSGFVDRTLNILEWKMESGDVVVLVVQRERSETEVSLDSYVARETKKYPSQFEAYFPERQDRTSLSEYLDVHHIAFRWKRENDVLYNHQAFLSTGHLVLVLTATGKAHDREQVDAVIESALTDLQFRED